MMSINLPFFNKKDKKIENKNIPNHVAIIMDGNGRWAKKRGLPRVAGHKEGMDVVSEIVKTASDCKVKVLTLYAFSTENWKRPKPEVDFIMRLPKDFLHKYLPEMMENNVKIQTIGECDKLPEHTKKAINHAVEETRYNDGLLLNFALNYGSRHEITRAMKAVMHEVKDGHLSIDDLTEEDIAKHLYTGGVPDPDLLIRTSGEKRLSNFLLWQIAYSEFWFTDVLWPDFTSDIFKEALYEYQRRKRRYGGI